jgi:V8-like Glu-specific endopeptidase
MNKIIFFSLIIASNIFSQSYQMIKYDIETSKIDTLQLVQFDTSKTSDFTNWNYGINNNIEELSLKPPQNTFNNSGFTDFTPAKNYFDINKYPIRTAIKIFRIVNDTLKQRCSGILVAKEYVLTDCHCIGEYDSLRNFVFEDSTYIYPAFDNGKANTIWDTTKAIEYVTFKGNLVGFLPQIDIALIKLKDNIGEQNGWIGIGFNRDDNFFKDNVFHKLSYPGTEDPSDSTRIFNGDTLYYNYGKLQLITYSSLGYGITGIPGQSGSSLFYTNNNEYYSVGTQVWSANSRHIRINNVIFYSFNSIIENTISSFENDNKIVDSYYLSNAYPNPFNPTTNINYILPKNTNVKLRVYNILGENVITLVNEFQSKGKYNIKLDGTNLSSGIYFYVLEANDFIQTKKAMLIK